MTDDTLACPECDDWDIRFRNGKDGTANANTWQCRACEAVFADPARRAIQAQSINRSGLARELALMDPEEIPP